MITFLVVMEITILKFHDFSRFFMTIRTLKKMHVCHVISRKRYLCNGVYKKRHVCHVIYRKRALLPYSSLLV